MKTINICCDEMRDIRGVLNIENETGEVFILCNSGWGLDNLKHCMYCGKEFVIMETVDN